MAAAVVISVLIFCAGQAERDKRKTGKTKTDVSGLSGSHQ